MSLNFSQHKHGNELLSILLNAKKSVSTDALLQQLHVSRRSLFYLINKVNDELDERAEFPITNVKNLGYYLPPETIEFLSKTDHDETTPQIHASNAKQRQTLMTFYLLSTTDNSLLNLSTRFGISKNTVIRDINALRQVLTTYQLTIENTSTGKIITGRQTNIRRWVYDHIKQIQSLVHAGSDNAVSVENIDKQIKLFEGITGKYLTDDAETTLSLFLCWYLNQIQDQHHQLQATHADQADSALEFTWATSLLTDYGISNPNEADYLIRLINASQFSHVNWQDPLIKQLNPIAVRMITDFNHLSGAYVSPKAIAESLTIHLVSTYYRAKYAMPFEYPDLNSIQEQYGQTFNLTRTIAEPFENFIHQTLSDDEIALIAIYFGGAIREQKNVIDTRNEVLVVCSSGIGTSRLLLKQLEGRYRGIRFSSPMNILQYENSNLKHVKLVISTIKLKPKNDTPITTVSALPSKLEWKIINDAIVQAGLANAKDTQLFNVDTLLDIVDNYAMVRDPAGLKFAFSDYLKQLTQAPITAPTPENTSEVTKLLPADHVGFLSHQKNWQQAVRSALDPLRADYTVEKNYINQIIALTEKNGPYMVVGSQVMLAHAAPHDGVNALGATLFLLDQPLPVMTAEKPVRLIIGLAPVDQKQHLPFISDLMEKLQDNNWLTNLFTLKSQSQLEHFLNII